MTDFLIDHTVSTPPSPAAWAEMQAEVKRLSEELERSKSNHRISQDLNTEYCVQIQNVEGYIRDQSDMSGELSDDCKAIAELLDIALTKEIIGRATIEISWSATVPMDFNADDLEISYSIDCDTYLAEDFDYTEESMEVDGDDN